MSNTTKEFSKEYLKQGLPEVRPGDTVRIYQRIKEKNKERLQPFEGVVLARKHGKGICATITVRKIVSGVGVEKILPIHTPSIEKIEVLKRGKVRRAKLYYLREAKGRKARLKRKDFSGDLVWEKSDESKVNSEEKPVAEKEAVESLKEVENKAEEVESKKDIQK